MGMGGHNIGDKREALLSGMETMLAILFTAEAALKITVLGARRYFLSRWVQGIRGAPSTLLGLHSLSGVNTCRMKFSCRCY